MKFSEWNQGEKDLFDELELLMPGSVFESIGGYYFSFYYTMKFGDAPVTQKVAALKPKEVAKMIHAINNKRWTTLTDIAEEIAYYTNFDKETIINEENLNNTLRELKSKTDSNVTGFDTDDTALNDSDNENLTETADGNSNKQYKKLERDIKNLDIRQSIIDNTNIVNIICTDIKNMVSLLVY